MKHSVQIRAEQLAQSSIVSSVDFPAQMAALLVTEIDDTEQDSAYSVTDGVATLEIRGLIVPETGVDRVAWGVTGCDTLVEYITAAKDDAGVSALVLDVDSGGGFMQGINTVVQALEDFGKPITTLVTGDMNSAAYNIGCVGTVISAYQGATVGSIGAYVTHTEYSKAYEKEGVTKRIFKSDFWKGAFSDFLPLSDKEAERLQFAADEAATIFRDTVVKHRNISLESIKGLAGDFFIAKKALEIGLIDEVVSPQAMQQESSVVAEYTEEQLSELISTRVAEALRDNAKVTAIAAHPTASEATKALLQTPAYAALDATAVAALLDASAPALASVEAVTLDTDQVIAAVLAKMGGAGVGPAPTEIVERTATEIQAERVTAASAKLATLNVKAL
jgi:capsid assembly protease